MQKNGYGRFRLYSLVEKVEPIIQVGHCYRRDTVIEPYRSTQWFVKMKPLAEPAIKAVEDGQIKFLILMLQKYI